MPLSQIMLPFQLAFLFLPVISLSPSTLYKTAVGKLAKAIQEERKTDNWSVNSGIGVVTSASSPISSEFSNLYAIPLGCNLTTLCIICLYPAKVPVKVVFRINFYSFKTVNLIKRMFFKAGTSGQYTFMLFTYLAHASNLYSVN